MKNKKYLLAILLILMCSILLPNPLKIPGELMLSFNRDLNNEEKQEFLEKFSQYDLKIVRDLSLRPDLIGYKLTFNQSRVVDDDDFLESIRKESVVRFVQFNHRVQHRTGWDVKELPPDNVTPILPVGDDNDDLGEFIPNDPYFHQQWALKNTGQNGGKAGSDVKATYAWHYLKNVVPNKNNREIVVAVIDRGFNIDNVMIDWQVNMIDMIYESTLKNQFSWHCPARTIFY